MDTQEKWDWETPEKQIANLEEIKNKYEDCREPVVTLDGEKIALPVQDEEDEWTLCVNGQPWEKTFELLWNPKFSPDNRLTALVQADDERGVAIDGTTWEDTFDYVWNTTFSSDGKYIAAQIKREDKYYSVIVNGKPWESNFLSMRELFLDDNGNVAVNAQISALGEADTVGYMKGVWGLALNDKAWDQKFVNVYRPIISSDGKHVAAEVRLGIRDYTIAVSDQGVPSTAMVHFPSSFIIAATC